MIHITASVEGDTARFELSGTWTTASIHTLVDEVERYCEDHERCLVLVDARPVARPPSDVRRHEAGKHIAERVGSRLRVAIVYRKPHVNKLLELSAVNRGATVLVTHSEDEARQWLGQDGPTSQRARVDAGTMPG